MSEDTEEVRMGQTFADPAIRLIVLALYPLNCSLDSWV